MEVCAYAAMSNHLHLVVKNDPLAVREWSKEEVARRWFRLFPGGRDSKGEPARPDPMIVRRFLEDEQRVEVCRNRLGNLSWYMRCLNEPIARRTNREDECSGRFREGRFKCQRLEDEGAVLACMAYVDLNPVRAGLAEVPEASEFTSIFERIAGRAERLAAAAIRGSSQSAETWDRRGKFQTPIDPGNAQSLCGLATCPAVVLNRQSLYTPKTLGHLARETAFYDHRREVCIRSRRLHRHKKRVDRQ